MSSVVAGQLIGREYRLERPLGAGGMGEVWVATQLATGRPRALKLLSPALATDARLCARFVDEARVGARIASEHVVEVVGSGIDEATKLPWLAMELLEGESLAQAIARRGAIPAGELADIVEQLGHALGAAHAAGIVHRDLKPENVFLGRAKRVGAATVVKVLDFGIAAVLPDDRTQATVTSALGTPLWWAPEQMRVGERVRAATDVWALGLIAFHALTGRFYWRTAYAANGSVATLVTEMLVDPLALASERAAAHGAPSTVLPDGFDAWFSRCVERDPSARFRDAGAATAALASILRAHAAGGAPMHGGAPRPVARSLAFAATLDASGGAGPQGAPGVAAAPVPIAALPSQPDTPARADGSRAEGSRGPSAPARSSLAWVIVVGGVLALGAMGSTVLALARCAPGPGAAAPVPAAAAAPARPGPIDAGGAVATAALAAAPEVEVRPDIAPGTSTRVAPAVPASVRDAPVEARTARGRDTPEPATPSPSPAPASVAPASVARASVAPVVVAPAPVAPAPVAPAPVAPSGPARVALEGRHATRRIGNEAGGVAYDDACPSGHALVGLQGNSVPYLGRLGAICAPLTVSAGRIAVGAPVELGVRGQLGGATSRVLCPSDEVVVGFHGRAGLLVDRIVLECAPLALDGSGAIQIGPRGPTDPIGGDGGEPAGRFSCGEGRVARVARIRAGDGIDAFGLGCAELRPW